MKQKILNYKLAGIFFMTLLVMIGKAQNCTCWQTRDSSFHFAPFNLGSPPYYRNDDGSTPAIALPFNFCFGGAQYDSLFINVNGNITFGMGFSPFDPDTFPQSSPVVPAMIAPFWGDVDLSGGTGGSDVVVYKLTPHHLIVQWDSVGYYDMHRDKLNSFQMILTDGTDSIIPAGSNVEFCYGDMQWTTGDVSPPGTMGGLGGDPATVGVNFGDGVNFIQFGLFDQAGNSYYGQFPSVSSSYDGVSWLDNNMFYYNLCPLPFPSMVSGISPCDTEILYSNDTIYFDMLFFVSKQGDTVIANPSTTLPPGVSIIANIPGHIDRISIEAMGPLATIGYHTVNFYGYDNSLHDTGYGSFVLDVIAPITTSSQSVQNENSIKVYPNPNNGIFTVACNLSESASEIHPTIEVYDLTGRQIFGMTLNQLHGDNIVDMSAQLDGVYFYRILSDQRKQISEGKIVIEK